MRLLTWVWPLVLSREFGSSGKAVQGKGGKRQVATCSRRVCDLVFGGPDEKIAPHEPVVGYDPTAGQPGVQDWDRQADHRSGHGSAGAHTPCCSGESVAPPDAANGQAPAAGSPRNGQL